MFLQLLGYFVLVAVTVSWTVLVWALFLHGGLDCGPIFQRLTRTSDKVGWCVLAFLGLLLWYFTILLWPFQLVSTIA